MQYSAPEVKKRAQGAKTRVAHTSRRSLAGCMRPLERGADMANYGTSAPPLIFIKFRGPTARKRESNCFYIGAAVAATLVCHTGGRFVMGQSHLRS